MAVTLDRHRQTERGLTQPPDACLVGRRSRTPCARARSPYGEITLERVQPGRQFLWVVGVELDTEERAWVAAKHCAPHLVEHGVLPRVAEDGAVHHLDGRRCVLEYRWRHGERVKQFFELDCQNRRGGRERHQFEPSLDHDAERAL